MARDLLRVRLDLNRIHCYDEGDGWGDAEPYLWTVFFKIDGESVALTEGLTLSGNATVQSTPGSHGNLGTSDVDPGEDVPIPSALGYWSPFLTPIPVPASLRPLAGDDLGGVVGVVCVLMEEDNVSDSGAEAGHQGLNNAVQNALDQVIATRSFANPSIGQAEIDQYLAAIESGVVQAIEDEQNFFENVWSAINPDDTIGSKVWFFTHDQLVGGGVIDFSQRWENEGDWELFGNVNASVACPAAALALASKLLASIFGSSSSEMRKFRDQRFGADGALPDWWAMAERAAPDLLFVLARDPSLIKSAGSLLRIAGAAARDGDKDLPAEVLEHAERLLGALHEKGGRRTRVEASRALALLPHLQGKTMTQAVELLDSVGPARHPSPRRPASHLLRPEIGVPATLKYRTQD